MKKRKQTFLIRFAKGIQHALRRRNVALYGSKYSKKTYTLHQHVVLLAVREYVQKGYEQFCGLLEDLVTLVEHLKLKSIPHFTTLQKVSQRIQGSMIEDLYLGFVGKAKIRAGMDSTGMSLQRTTHYYEQRLEHFRKSKKKQKKLGRPSKRRKRKHQHTNMCVDLDKQLILGIRSLRGSKSDSKSLQPTLNKIREIHKLIDSLDADKGYDAEYNHKYVRETMHATSCIALKNKEVPVHRTKGVHRKHVKRTLYKKRGRPRKNHRNKAESVIFVFKRIFGEHVSALTAMNQRQQLRIRGLAYNAYRKARALFIEDFYEADQMVLLKKS